MCAFTDSPEPVGRGLEQPGYGKPSAELLARANRGLTRFLAGHEDPESAADEGET
ncbi:hypothetical protein ACIPY6_41020 [Streptomyces sp. NPDC090054]|uniref:hypothetical protein n=1 Tax=Streptomyces sp. NPDC090054 TaxID=3365933 RepID=UPI0037F8037B